MMVSLLTTIGYVIQAIYIFCMIVLFMFGLNSLILSIIYIVNRKRIWTPKEVPIPEEWPLVTIQLPMYNERYMVRRLLKAVTSLAYPSDRLQIQVLDDSTDSTVDLVRALVERYQENGVNIQYIHRTERKGYKAGALDEGLRTATGEFVAVFDADFVPKRDFLIKMIPHFHDPKVGFVQSRWSHKNDRYNLLTRWESLALDAHFVVEQGARAGGNLIMGFNGSGGIWRRVTIDEAGGWASDTLTEDLDLSVRAELKGWKYVYLPNVTVPSEVPAHIDAVKKQQYRWSKGTVQTFRKLAGTVLRSDLPLHTRYMAFVHMGMYLPFLFMVVTLLLVLPVGLINSRIFVYFPFTILATLGPPLLYSLARTEHNPRFIDRLQALPGLMLLGTGISLNCGLGALVGLLRKGGTFDRTPKFDLQNGNQHSLSRSSYFLPTNPIIWAEIVMGFYNMLTVYLLRHTVGMALAPWLLTTAAGFFMVAWMSLKRHWDNTQRASKKSTEREPAI